MPDQKIEEFRELAESAVVAPDPEVLLQRGRARRRRRQLAPVVAVAAVTAAVLAISATGGDPRTDEQPAGRPSQSAPTAPEPTPTGPDERFLHEVLGLGRVARDAVQLHDEAMVGQAEDVAERQLARDPGRAPGRQDLCRHGLPPCSVGRSDDPAGSEQVP